MKTFNNITKAIFMALAIFMVVSCQDSYTDTDELRDTNYKNKVSTAAPKINGVYTHSSYVAGDTETSLSKVNLGDYIVISGENLQGISSIVFNADELDMSEIYSQWDMIVMRVPEELPQEITNTFTCKTKLGSTEIPLGLQLPDAVFTSLENEFAMPGTNNAKIVGKNFALYGFDTERSSVVMYNTEAGYEKSIEVAAVSNDYMEVNIPADAPDNSLFKFILDGEENEQKLYYRPTDLLIWGNAELTNNVAAFPAGVTVDFTDGTGSDEPSSLIPSLDGGAAVKYFRVRGSLNAWQVIIQVFFPTEIKEFVIPEGKTSADYDFVYEVFTSGTKPIPVGNSYKCQFSDAGLIGMWNNFGTSEINTGGEWVTYRANLATALGGNKKMKDKLIVKTAMAIPEADHAFANFRIEPTKP